MRKPRLRPARSRAAAPNVQSVSHPPNSGRDLYLTPANRTSGQTSSVSKTFAHWRLVFLRIRVEARANPRNVQPADTVCANDSDHTVPKIFALTQAALPEPLPNISIKPTVLGEGAPRLQVYINAVELAIIANSIASNIILKAVCTTGALSNSSIMMMLGKEP